MLQIKNISKRYKTGDLVQIALNDVSLNFRENEFVSILGPSGSGKTTLLNIIGGLDRYDSGDLIINNVSTKNYKDRDWDSYRNHTIGFVFQSYNLIPHQTVLANVELALTIGGISKKERRRRALEALEEVGLREQGQKRPNQMSGGQMQRVAIARALVNNPDILLADEPTGALDTETSVQVMELLKKVAEDRLVIMVTHNPELAEEYSTRIVKLRDGRIIDDSNPFTVEEAETAPPVHKNLGKASMSVFTALALSFNNLLTKKGRTILTAFAGSIGIIGIALILSLSTGFQNYIDKIQEDTLTSYPLTITQDTVDMTSMLLSMVSESQGEESKKDVAERQYMTTMFSQLGRNDLTSFKNYLKKENEKVEELTTLVEYQYNVSPLIYTIDVTDKVTQLNPSNMLSAMGLSGMAATGMNTMSSGAFNEMLDNHESLQGQYDILAGRWPEAYNELLLVLPEKGGISDLLVYSLGLRDGKEMEKMLTKLMEGEKIKVENEPLDFTYEELMDVKLKLVNPADLYKYNKEYKLYENMTGDKAHMEKVYDNSVDLIITGIVCAKEGSDSANLMPGVAYRKELTEFVIETAAKTEIVQKQLENTEVDVFTGKRFDDESKDNGLDFQNMMTIDEKALKEAFAMDTDMSKIEPVIAKGMGKVAASMEEEMKKMQEAFPKIIVSFAVDFLNDSIEKGKETLGTMAALKPEDVEKLVKDYLAREDVQEKIKELEELYQTAQKDFETIYEEILKDGLNDFIQSLPEFPGEIEITEEMLLPLINELITDERIEAITKQMASQMSTEAMEKKMTAAMTETMGDVMKSMMGSFRVDADKMKQAFQFNMTEEEMTRLIESMMESGQEKNAILNLNQLGYQNLDEPTSISFYFKDFDAKEEFIEFIDHYNDEVVHGDEEKTLKYTDLTGLLMSSVKTIVDSVTYVLIAFVSISLVVSSIMIGIITYISVLERTKEIGVLRAIGASKKNISSIFNAETFIVGLFAGLLGISVTLALVPPINQIIHNVSGNMDINAVLPMEGAVTLVVLSVILTLIGGLIPSRQAAKKDPVTALRSE